MKLPKRLKIGAHEYEIQFPYKFQERTDLCGQHEARLRRIRLTDVDPNGNPYPRTEKVATFLHEVLHAVDDVYSMGKLNALPDGEGERIIEGISQGLAQVFLDNGLLRLPEDI